MGMYTQLVLGCQIKKDKLEEIKPILTYMKGELDKEPELPDHPFFKTERWDVLFRMDSAYFDLRTRVEIINEEYLDIVYLNVITNIKNYNGEIELFLDWIDEYLSNHEEEFIGFKRYEESNQPCLLYKGRKFLYVNEDAKLCSP